MVSDALLAEYREFSSTLCLDVLRAMGYQRVWLKGVRSLTPGQTLAGRAVTVRFLPARPDMAAQWPQGADGAIYRAIERCGPGDALVLDALGYPYEAVGGDIKFLRLKMRGAAGLVTDGAIRDSREVRGYNLALFAQNVTARAGPTDILPFEENRPIQCGGVTVAPGDLMLGDDDGVIVVPAQLAAEVARLARHRAAREAEIRARVLAEDVSPGHFYPFADVPGKDEKD
jgi:regulator of RNase E activity RraA